MTPLVYKRLNFAAMLHVCGQVERLELRRAAAAAWAEHGEAAAWEGALAGALFRLQERAYDLFQAAMTVRPMGAALSLAMCSVFKDSSLECGAAVFGGMAAAVGLATRLRAPVRASRCYQPGLPRWAEARHVEARVR